MAVTTKRVMEASALLVFFSIFALVEGVIRMTSFTKPTNEDEDIDYWDTMDGTVVPVGVRLIAGCAQVLIGILGVFVGIGQFLFEYGSPAITRTFALVQAILSAFVFGVFVIAVPVLDAKETNGIPGLFSQKEHRYMIVLGGLLGSLTFCFAVLGGQFSMILRLLSAQNNRSSGTLFQALVWSVNQILIAGSTLYVGIHLLTKDFENSEDPATAVPHFVFYPLIAIITGGIMFAYGIAGVLGAFSSSFAQRAMPLSWMIATLAMMVNFSWTFGMEPGVLTMTVPYAAQHVGLVLAVTLLPVLHAWRTHRPLREDVRSTMGNEKVHNSSNGNSGMEQPLPQAQQRRRDDNTYLGDEDLA